MFREIDFWSNGHFVVNDTFSPMLGSGFGCVTMSLSTIPYQHNVALYWYGIVVRDLTSVGGKNAV